MNKKVKKTFIGAFLTTSLFIGINSVGAVTIKETTSSEGSVALDKIADNTFVIGATKFDENVILTAKRAIKASSLYENLYNKEAELYYYIAGTWLAYDDDNVATVITDEATLSSLNEQAIYYVNNKEKMLEISYTKDLEEGYNLVFETDNFDKNSEVKYENGTLYVPATVKELEVFAVKDEVKTALDVFTKGELSESQYGKKSSLGKVEVTSDVTNTVENDIITINGTINWVNKDNSKTSTPGNFVSVKFTKPDVYETITNATIKILKNGEVVTDTIALNIDNEYYLSFVSKEDTYEVLITWEKGNIQTFSVNLSEDATIALPPKGNIAQGDQGTGGTLTYTTENNKITINGNLAWVKGADVQNGRIAGNYAAVKISAPEGYTKDYLTTNAKVKIDTRAEANWKNIIYGDEDTYFVYYPRFDSNTRTHTVLVTWEEGNTQEFEIVLDEEATLDSAIGGTITRGEDTLENNFVVANNTEVTVKGEVKWYTSTEYEASGNYVTVNINAPEDYNNTNANVKVDDQTAAGTTWSTNNNTSYAINLKFAKLTDTHKIYVTWENGNTQEFTVSLDETATFEKAPAGTIEVGTETADTYVPTGNDMVVNAKDNLLKWSKSDIDKEAGNYAVVKINAPENYNGEFLKSNAKYKIDNGTSTNWENNEKSFTKYIKFATKSEIHTITVLWENGNTQEFSISLGETTDLEKALAGTITIDNSVGGKDLIVNTTENPNVLELDGTISYDKELGNAFAYKITAPTSDNEYTSDNINASSITINSYTDVVSTKTYRGSELFSKGSFVITHEKLKTDFKYDEIIIKWENGNTQTFIVKAKDTLTLEERPNYVTGISVKSEREVDDNKLVIGNTLQLNATLTTEKNMEASNSNVTWESSNESVATVDKNGLVTSLSYGSATITVTSEDGKYKATYQLNSEYPEMKTTIYSNAITSENTKTVSLTFNTTGGNKTYTYEFTVKEKNTSSAVNISSFDIDKSCLTLNITDKTKSYIVEYTIKDGVNTELKGTYEV